MDDFVQDADYGDENVLVGTEIELEDGVVMEKAPDGGKRAWLIVLSCFFINLIVQTMTSLITIGLGDSDVSKTLNITSEDARKAVNYYQSLSDLFAPFGVLVMIRFGYKITVIAGSLIVCFSFTNMSMLGGGTESSIGGYWQFWLCGPAALGVNFLKIGALIPVLEYFEKKRMKALVLSRLGFSIGGLITMGFIFVHNIKWRTVFRVNAGLCVLLLLTAFTLRNIGITRKEPKTDDEVKRAKTSIFRRVLSIFDPPVLKNRTFWIIMVVFFFFKFGLTPAAVTLPTLTSGKVSGNSKSIVSSSDMFSAVAGASAGNLGGMGTAFLLKRLKFMKRFSKRSLMFVLTMVAISGPLIGVCLVPTPSSYGPYIFFNLVVSIFQVVSENMRDESIPTVFGRSNIRITESFLNMFVGVAGMIAGAIQHGVDKADEKTGWKVNLKLAGSFLIIVGVATAVLIILHKMGKFNLKENAVMKLPSKFKKAKNGKKRKSNDDKNVNDSNDDDNLPKDIDEISMTHESGKLQDFEEHQAGNYHRSLSERERPARSYGRSPEPPRDYSNKLTDKTERMQQNNDMSSVERHPSSDRSPRNVGNSMYAGNNINNSPDESERMQNIYGMTSVQRHSSMDMMNEHAGDLTHQERGMNRSHSNPGYTGSAYAYTNNMPVNYGNQVGNPIYQIDNPHMAFAGGSQNMPQYFFVPYNQPMQTQGQSQRKHQGQGQRKKGKDKKQKSNNATKGQRQRPSMNDRYIPPREASGNYVEEQITNAGTVLY